MLLEDINEQVRKYELKFIDRLVINNDLSRKLVSFQANKTEPVYRWFKYREGFSKPLVNYLLDHARVRKEATLLDPFAGSGAACFVGLERNLKAIAIELMSVGCHFMELRNYLVKISNSEIKDWIKELTIDKPWLSIKKTIPIQTIKITFNAYPKKTEEELGRFRYWSSCQKKAKKLFCEVLALSILEEISYTRKDGQYLRWDSRAERERQKSSFNKGIIYTFDEAIEKKCQEILEDLSLTSELNTTYPVSHKLEQQVKILPGSNFQHFKFISNESIDIIITSPPYCNRYDYTRTYALELAYLGCGETEIRSLRQSLLSCTVENKRKNLKDIVPIKILKTAEEIYSNDILLPKIIAFLKNEWLKGRLNNQGIIRMIEGYFFEMAIIIVQCATLMRKNGKFYMVNDNVRYNGLDIPVDCILSSFAEAAGLKCHFIWVSPQGKGNSSQQMKKHGRSTLRKCVYVWEKL